MSYHYGNVQVLYPTVLPREESVVEPILSALKHINHSCRWSTLMRHSGSSEGISMCGTKDDRIHLVKRRQSDTSVRRALLIGSSEETSTLREHLEVTLEFDRIHRLKNPKATKLQILRTLVEVAQETRQDDVLVIYFGGDSRKSSSVSPEPHSQDPIIGEFGAKTGGYWCLKESEFLACLSHQLGVATVIFESRVPSPQCFASFPIQVSLMPNMDHLEKSLLSCGWTDDNAITEHDQTRIQPAMMPTDISGAVVDMIVGSSEAFFHSYVRNQCVRNLIMGMRAYSNHREFREMTEIPHFYSSNPIDDSTRLNLEIGISKNALLLSPSNAEEPLGAMRRFLVDTLGYLDDDIVELKGNDFTHENVLKAMVCLRRDCDDGDQCFIYCHGASSQQGILSFDGISITCSEIFETLVLEMDKDVTLTFLVDSCTWFRLPYSMAADDNEAKVYIRPSVVSICMMDTHLMLANVLEEKMGATVSWTHVADFTNGTVTASRPIVPDEPIEIVSKISGTHQKRALLIAETNDDPYAAEKIDEMQQYLEQFHGFRHCDICRLENRDDRIGSRIIGEFHDIVRHADAYDNLVVYYCGQRGVESSPDAIIVPSDADLFGSITGRHLLEELILLLPEEVRLTIIVDVDRNDVACVPLPYFYAAAVSDEAHNSKRHRKTSLSHMLKRVFSPKHATDVNSYHSSKESEMTSALPGFSRRISFPPMQSAFPSVTMKLPTVTTGRRSSCR